jgi:paraquat-inducible protein B
MSKKASPTLIGGFVLGAAALAVAAVVILGSGALLSPSSTYVIYFKGSITGLNVGAPVNFRGVNIGTVTGVEVELDPGGSEIRTPVYVEIERSKFRTVGGEVAEQDVDRILDDLVARGLKAQLLSESLVTGLKAVEFDFFPDYPVELVGDRQGVRELPTVPSNIEQLTAELKGLPIAELAASTRAVMEALSRLVSSPQIQDLPEEVNAAVTDIRAMLRTIDERIARVTASLETTSSTANETLLALKGLMTDEEGPIVTLAGDLEKTSGAMRDAMEQTRTTFKSLEGAVAGSGDMQHELTVALREVGAAARALRQLAEELERSPESLLRGKGGSRP